MSEEWEEWAKDDFWTNEEVLEAIEAGQQEHAMHSTTKQAGAVEEIKWLKRNFLEHRQDGGGNINDIEDLDASTQKTPFQKHRGNKGFLSVTDMCSMEWCGLQFHYTLEGPGRKPETSAMKLGKRIHSELELELHDLVEIQATTKEDTWGLRLLNCVTGLQELMTSGKTRELPVFGFVRFPCRKAELDSFATNCATRNRAGQYFLIYGVLDEITRKESRVKVSKMEPQKRLTDFFGNAQKVNGDIAAENANCDWDFLLSDTKTKVSDRLAKHFSAQRSARMQLMVYKYLYDSLVTTSSQFPCKDFFSTLDLDPDLPLSTEVLNYAKFFIPTLAIDDEGPPLLTLRTLLNVVLSHFALFPTLENKLCLSYVHQETLSSLGEIHFTYSSAQLAYQLNKALGYWSGEKMEPVMRGVDISEAGWKCWSCDYFEQCEWRRTCASELAEKSQLRS
ncbi:hypothetical protein BZG36_04646 [Bifiguratus adelaidae]|uniref:Exonuclease V, mitochondrial n=1 Tax=Bifiguratus adelaidae TaxID=1938954 RepID=A0A261XXR8_9FUNG|nr:hypothetical protein BZG36_04646 [Bifiguratus adelaidae]